MPFQSENSFIPIPPPGEDELPYDDGEPMESERHLAQMGLLIEALQLFWRDRDDVYVAGNMAIYFSELQAKKNDFRGPDVFVVLDTNRRERKSWVVWQEDGRTPDVVIELLSESTQAVDRGDKMRIYAKLLHVPEYYLFDPFSGELEAYALDRATRSYLPMPPEANGEVVSACLGLRLGVRHGTYRGLAVDWLRWIDTHGRVLPTGEEQARAAEEQARAAEEQARAAGDETKRLAARLAAYEKQFGPLPGGGSG
ncbi:Uma2 family endonuclease [Sorangium atrum]|uniref:Uma2 family endonuclease n=1 Tax=Sorangium atrum TaxID=2995308 RepID=A0ABT5CJ59_9BACT|nr:Uma2 family endonuclease [Sorangium aterium]MDC0685885.1 Uma2 family endonuclease [Sorangium aterium]